MKRLCKDVCNHLISRHVLNDCRIIASFLFNRYTYPIPKMNITVDVIKTRYLSDAIGRYKSPISCITATYKEAGVIGFFKVLWTVDLFWNLFISRFII